MHDQSSPISRTTLKSCSLRRWAALGALLSFGASAAFGQAVTTSTLSGRVLDEHGAPVSGAAVVVTHEPTGSTYNTATRNTGTYAVRSLRPGGPYRVEVTASGYYPFRLLEVYLGLDQENDFEIRLRSESLVELEEFVVTGSDVASLFRGDRAGSGTDLNEDDLASIPVGDRSLNSLLRADPTIAFNRDPFDRAFSAGGISNRFNSILVDGVSGSDPFGLNANNTAAERNVIPLDAIEAISITTAPYSTRRGGFVGAQINSVTKSGTNQLSGSVYFTYRDQSMVGEDVDGTFYGLPDFEEKTFGLTLGGPIIKNKLFFFLSYEKVKEDRIAPAPTTPVDPTALQQIITQANALGINPGGLETGGNQLTDESILAKIDWQINDAHRLTVRYQNVESSRPTFPGFGSGNSRNNFSFDTHWYDQKITNKSYIAQLFSRWSDTFDTEFTVSRSEYYSEPINNSRLPYVEIRNVPVSVTGEPTAFVFFGTERSRHANLLEVNTNTLEFFGNLELNSQHTLQFGLQYDVASTYNMFVQDIYGRYVFNTLDGFLNQAATGGWAGTYQYNFALPGVNPAAEFDEGNWGLFIQDVWKVSPNLTLNLGLRVDIPEIKDDVPENPLFEQVFGRTNTYTYDGKTAVQPRFGFNFQTGDTLKTQVRGGIGLFYGRMPRVWLSNSYSNTGMNYGTYFTTSTAQTPAFSPDPDNQPAAGGGLTQQIAFIEPGFELPTRWKTNLAIDQELGFWGLVATVEWQRSWVEKDVLFQNHNLAIAGTLPDGRNRYSGVIDNRFTNRIIGLTNTDKGWNQSITVAIERPRKKDGWYYKVAYTNSSAREVQFGTSSVGASNWQNRAIFNPGEDVESVAELEIRDRIIALVRKDFELVKGFRTTLSLFYEGRSGYPFSFVTANDYNSDTVTGNDLAYIPAPGEANYAFADATQQALFYQLVEQWGLPTGQATKSGQGRYPFVHQFDFGIKQEIKLPGFRHRLEIGLDLLNIGNLINDKWGVIHGSNQFFFKRENLATYTYNAGTGVTTISNVNSSLANRTFSPSLGRGEPAATRWSALLTVRYKF